ncbi:MAG: hypothetical protein F6K54_40570 [Okeania sp. SIO3B5]|uniref:hypothetical protein n=1 Tax=Okeania sp. SIO3B5 TaxID=2607811 RepID=UPI0014001F8E|nr:hypothetical protein [Okeania sp. SIO3B5]NEO58778.1 hypothetical protein [Okeania sp. SIO3B5]
MSSENLTLFETEYKAGKYAFERGQYRNSVQHLETAKDNIELNSRFGGEVQIWLVTAYQAAGQIQEATALCKQLTRHPRLETRQQAKRILVILEAPVLRSRQEWMTKIPDLGAISESDAKDRRGSTMVSQVKSPPPKPKTLKLEVVDPSQVNTKDNQFVWVALVLIILTVSGLVWFS